MQEGYLRPSVFLYMVLAPCAGFYQHQARNKFGNLTVFKTSALAARTYALSRLNRKLLQVFLTLGMVHVGLGIALMYDSRDRGELYLTRALRGSFI